MHRSDVGANPVDPEMPVARISGAAAALSVCSPLTLSGLGSTGCGAFPLTYAWSATLPATTNVTLSAALAAHLSALPAYSSVITIPPQLLPFNSSFQISLQVDCSELSSVPGLLRSRPETITIFKGGRPLVSATFDGAAVGNSGMVEKRVFRTAVNAIVTSVGLPGIGCLGPTDLTMVGLQLTFGWSLQQQTMFNGILISALQTHSPTALAALGGAATNSRELRIERNTLMVGTSYLVHVTATPIGAMAGFVGGSSASLLLHVDPSPLMCLIGGGSQRVLGADAVLMMVAGVSDPDDPGVPPLVHWSCVDVHAEALAATAASLGANTSSFPPPPPASGPHPSGRRVSTAGQNQAAAERQGPRQRA